MTYVNVAVELFAAKALLISWKLLLKLWCFFAAFFIPELFAGQWLVYVSVNNWLTGSTYSYQSRHYSGFADLECGQRYYFLLSFQGYVAPMLSELPLHFQQFFLLFFRSWPVKQSSQFSNELNKECGNMQKFSGSTYLVHKCFLMMNANKWQRTPKTYLL